MGWKCYSCGAENSNDDVACTQCGNTVAAPKQFYVHWVFGAAVFFAVCYLAGTMAGQVLIEAVAAPDDAAILAVANAQRDPAAKPYESVMELDFNAATAAKAVAVEKAKAAMSATLRGGLQWVFPVLLFVICGIIVGFVSEGVTIVEAAIGAVLGQLVGVVLDLYVFKTGATGWMAMAVGALPGAALGAAGAWLGEWIQSKKEGAH